MKSLFQENFQLHLGDCLEVMRSLQDNSVDLILTDPPYFRVKSEQWDHQWDTSEAFIGWIGELCIQWQRILRPQGSLYVFASPQMAARVELKIAESFTVLNHIVWRKENGLHKKSRKESLRRYFPQTERIIFAEQRSESSSSQHDKRRSAHFESLRVYLDAERRAANLSAKESNRICGNQMAGHYFGSSQWQLPSADCYAKLAAATGRFQRDYQSLKQEYDKLSLRIQPDRADSHLRRPFAITSAVPYTDVWDFAKVEFYPGKHPCEKPVAMLRHIVLASTTPGAVVMDCFVGSGAHGEAALQEGRRFVGIERSAEYADIARRRLVQTSSTRMH